MARLVRLSVSSTGGVRLTGVSVGTGLLRARYGRTERTLIVRVMRQIGPLGAGDVIASGTWYAGSWGEQPKYHQWKPMGGYIRFVLDNASYQKSLGSIKHLLIEQAP